MQIVCTGVTAGYGSDPALRDINCTVTSGERVALLGPSGAGKTTLLRVLGAMHLASAGSVTLDGSDPAVMSARQRRHIRTRIASIPQGHDLVERLDCRRNVLAGRSGRWGLLRSLRVVFWPLQSEAVAADAALARVGLADFAERRADSLSGGQHQRVAIARACYQEANLLLADEPVASLDRTLAEEVVAQLADIATSDGRTLIASLHDPLLARRHCTRAIGLRAGRMMFDRPIGEVDDAVLQALYA